MEGGWESELRGTEAQRSSPMASIMAASLVKASWAVVCGKTCREITP